MRGKQKPSFDEWIRERRSALELSQQALAVRAGHHYRTIQEYEAGRYPVTPLRVLEALGIELPFRVDSQDSSTAR